MCLFKHTLTTLLLSWPLCFSCYKCAIEYNLIINIKNTCFNAGICENGEKNIMIPKLSYRLQCWGGCSELQWPTDQKSAISVTKATESTFKMDQVTCQFLQGGMRANYTRLRVYGYRTFPHAGTGGICNAVNNFEEASKTLVMSVSSFLGLLETGSICLFSQLWLLSTLDTALLTQGWETAHGCLKCASPQNLQSCEWFEWGWYSMWYVGTRFSVTFNILQWLDDRVDV